MGQNKILKALYVWNKTSYKKYYVATARKEFPLRSEAEKNIWLRKQP